MPHNSEKLLQDMIDAGTAIETLVSGATRDSYGSQLMLRSAVERQFEILGEALRRLAILAPELVGRISEHRRIIAVRNGGGSSADR
jgi:uncharacterized protein with HEPN domain